MLTFEYLSFVITFAFLILFSYVLLIFIYCKHIAYRATIKWTLLIWTIIWLVFTFNNFIEWKGGNSEIYEGLFWVGLPLTRPVESEVARRCFSDNMRYFLLCIFAFFNWSGVILIAAILIKKAIAVCKIKK